ncbi:receptor-type tyrosine-protein phosphatase eta [Channa argus]|uniref:receptor-type tyrosine-protein phosphatase eta n=1 Tax=Channa argus TaxID=215402 RepID=UPI00351FA85F
MKPLLGFILSLWTLLVFSGLHKSVQAQSIFTAPAAVMGLSIAEINTSSLSLNWTEPVGNHCSYKVNWTDGNVSGTVNVTATSATITNLTAGVRYSINVSAVADDEVTEGPPSAIFQYTKPAVVGNLTVSKITTSSVFLNWTQPVGKNSFYKVHWSDGYINMNLNMTETYANITGLTAGVQYMFTVKAVAGDQETIGDSNTVSQYTRPTVVGNLTVIEFTTSSVFLNWTQPVGNISFYKVHWSDGNLNMNLSLNQTYVNITGLTAGVQYTFTVIAVAGDNITESENTQIIHYTRPTVVGNLTVTEFTTSSVFLNWTQPVGNISFYKVHWSDGNLNMNLSTNQTYMNITGLTAGVQYTFTVIAVAGDNITESENAQIIHYTRPTVVGNLTVSKITTSSVFLNWTQPVGNISFYKVHWTDGNLNMNLSTNQTYVNITGLTAGVQYTFTAKAVAGDQETIGEANTISLYTRPTVVGNLTVIEFTTSSVFLNWTQPVGNISFYKVHWSDGNLNMNLSLNQTYVNITELTAGVQYMFTVIAVAGDNITESENAQIIHYTRPTVVGNLTVTEFTTSSVFLNWTQPVGNISFYKVHWSDGNLNMNLSTNQTYINITGLTAGVQYTFTVIAVAGDNITECENAQIIHYTRPTVVGNLTVSKITTSSVFLNWTQPVGNISFYKVHWTDGNLNMNLSTNQTYVNITGLTAGVQYTFTAKAVAGDQETIGESNTVSQYTRPTVVGNLTVIEFTTSSVFLNWTQPVGNISFYKVHWSDGNLNTNLSLNQTYVNITGLTAGVQYTFTVIAVAGDNITESENTQIIHYTRPTVVRNLTVTEFTTSSVFLNWTQPVGNISFYKVHWSDGNLNMNLSTNQTYMNITGLTAGVQYTFTVIAVAGDNITESENAQIIHYTRPTVVGNLTVSKITTSSVFLNWTQPVGNISFYKVHWTDGNLNMNLSTNQTYVNITGLTAGVQYTFTAKAVAGDQETIGEANTISLYTRPTVVGNLTIIEFTTSYVFLNWTQPLGNISFYKVHWSDGNLNMNLSLNQTYVNITGLTAGVQYTFTVIAVAGDYITKSENAQIIHYTRPTVVGNLTVSKITTSSVFLNWTQPVGNISFYKVHWSDGNLNMNLSTNQTYVNITGLTAGVQYTFTVKAVAGDHETIGEANTVSQYTKPAIVGNLMVSQFTTSSVFLNWTQPVGYMSFYKVHWSDGNLNMNLNTTETYVNITGLTAGVQYTFTVIAVAGDNITESENTQIILYTRPTVVGNLTVSKITTTTVFLNWAQPVGNISFYKVHWSDGNLNMNLSTNQTYVNITGLTAGVQYTFTVIAVAGDNITESENAQVIHYTKPAVVENLTVTDITTSSVFLNWTQPVGNISFYKVHWSDGNLNMNLSTNQTYMNITGLTAGVQYTFTVIAVAGDNITESENAQIIHYTRPTVVGNLTVSKITISSVFLNWTQPVGNISFYKVHWSDGNLNMNLSTNQTYMNITGLTAGVQYTFTVKAVAGDQETRGEANTVSQYTKPAIVGNLMVSQFTTSSLFLNWTQPVGNMSFYKVHWTDGNLNMNLNTTKTYVNITGLTAGVQYRFTVIAVAGDNITESENTQIIHYTRPTVVGNLTVSKITTSSVFLNWTQPVGNISFYKVHWSDGNLNMNLSTNQTYMNITGLTAGVQYTFTVKAVAGDQETRGEANTVSQYTRPGQIANVSVFQNCTSISLSWISPPGQVFVYKVVYNSSGSFMTSYTNFVILSNLTAGTPYTIKVIAVAGDNQTEGDPYIFRAFTTPDIVVNLTITDVTTSSVSLNWSKPIGGATLYIVQCNSSQASFMNTTANTSFTILGLTPGFQYNITVAAEAVTPTNQGTGALITTFTRPQMPSDITSTKKGTDYLIISWTLRSGRVDYYVVNITEINQKYSYSNLATATTANLTNLNPGRMHVITVTAVAGNYANTSNQSYVATAPVPPAYIIISQRTNSSLSLQWPPPSFIENASSISYNITYQAQGGAVQSTISTVNNTDLSLLSSGTLYNITVATVGPQNLMSTVVGISSFTLPNPVLNLTASPQSSTSVMVTWSYPMGAQSYYTYLIKTYNNTTLVNSTTVRNNSTNVTYLGPGTGYNFSVRTIAAEESSSMDVQTFSYTKPSAVRNLTVNVNTSAIQLTWLRQPDYKTSYSYFLIASNVSGVIRMNSTNTETFTFFNLTPGELYNFSVSTVVQEIHSTVQTISSYTRPEVVSNIIAIGSTTNMSVSWTPAAGHVESYSVLLYKNDSTTAQLVNSESNLSSSAVSKLFLDLTPGMLYCVVVVSKSGPLENNSTSVCNATFPNPPGLITVVSQTVNSINFTWSSPVGMASNSYNFIVSTIKGSFLIQNNWFLLDNLQSGTPYNISVVTVAWLNYTSTAVTTQNYTMPETVQPSISSQGSNSSILVSWTKPQGNVEMYRVNLNSPFSALYRSVSSNTSILFVNLSAGMLYTAMVTTVSGPFSASSGNVTNATFPNPPGPIKILTKTTSSIDIEWEAAPLMTNTSFAYQLPNISSWGAEYINTTNTTYAFFPLLSGTSYNISVATKGVMGFVSKIVWSYMITTRPFPVKFVMASVAAETYITVTWASDNDTYKKTYSYILAWQSQNQSFNTTIKDTGFNISGLNPGSFYNFSVTTVTSDGTQGAPTMNSSCTNASPVTNISCEGPNRSDAKLLLSWSKPSGQFSGFLFKVDPKGPTTELPNTCFNKTVSGLQYYTKYTVTVVTQSCGLSSTPLFLYCQTGITTPTIPDNYMSLSSVSSMTYNKFSIQIKPSLLNDSNGPITHVGVLVTNRPAYITNLTSYLNITYDQWKKGDSLAYLATIIEMSLQSRSPATSLSIEVGNMYKWNNYTNGALEANTNYRYAIVLFTSLNVQAGLVSSIDSIVSITDFSSSFTLPQDAVLIAIAAGVTLGIAFVVFIILICLIIYCKRLSNKKTSDIQIHSLRAKVNVAVRVEDYEAYYKKQKADSNCGFAEEFEDLKPVGTSQTKTNALILENKPKNRYNNVLPYDSSRVKLSIIHGSPYDDYINANYMPGYNSRKEFIAAQGPLPTTVNEFWRMIWEKNVQTLVMLTRCNEQGRVKCEQYWSSGTKHYENITVKTNSEIPLEDWTIRDFSIKNVKTAETRSVRHFHFTAWPDHGVPETTELLISFRHLVREHMDQFSKHSPTVVHCSAGVGRTGTFITIDRLIFQIERENIVDVYGIVHDLRMHRPLMVQTEDQYVFLNQCALDIIRSRTGTNVDLIYQNTAALSIYENIDPKKQYLKNGYNNA